MMTNAEATQRTTAAVVRPIGWWGLGIARILVGYLPHPRRVPVVPTDPLEAAAELQRQ